MMSKGIKTAAQNRNNHSRRAEIGDANAPGGETSLFLDPAFFGKCRFDFKWFHSH
jgi:hypothetical protein